MKHNRSNVSFRRWNSQLFDQQMWCFGRDIMRTQGNILLDLGMCQYRSNNPESNSTMYTCAVEPKGMLFLWGFGVMYTEPGFGGVFLARYDFLPKWTPRESAMGVHRMEDLGTLLNPGTRIEISRMRHLLPQMTRWFARYEHYIVETYGIDYRDRCLEMRSQAPVVPAPKMAREWEQTAKKCKEFRGIEAASVDPWKKLIQQFRTVPFESTTYHPPTRVMQ
jgi:hypothetical protein